MPQRIGEREIDGCDLRDGAHRRSNSKCSHEEVVPLKVGPRDQLVTGRKSGACVNLNGDAKGGSAHRAGSLEALYGLDEAPSGYCSHLDLARLDERIAADDTPTVVERLHHGNPLHERQHELVRQYRREQLADFAALDATDRRRGAESGRSRCGAATPDAEKGTPTRRGGAHRAHEGDSRNGPRAGGGRGSECAASCVGERTGHRPGRGVITQNLVLRYVGPDNILEWHDYGGR